MKYIVRYKPGTDLANRFPGSGDGLRFRSREHAEEVHRQCPNAEHMETVEVDE